MKKIVLLICILSIFFTAIAEDINTYKAKISSLIKQKEYQKALSLIKKASIEFPNNFFVHFNSGYIYQILKEYDKAEQEYQKALLLKSSNEQTLKNLEVLYRNMFNKNKQDIDKLKIIISKAKKYFDETNSLLLMRGEVKRLEKKYQEAIDIFKLSIKKYRDKKAISLLAYTYRLYSFDRYKNKDYKSAVSIAIEGIKISGNNPYLYNIIINSLLELGNIEKAKLYLKKAVALYPKDKNIRSSNYYIYMKKGEEAFGNEDYAKALILFEKASTFQIPNANLENWLGLTYMNIERFSDAEKSFISSLSLDPNNNNAKFNISHLYTKKAAELSKSGKIIEANQYLYKALQYSESDDIYNLLGFCRISTGNFKEAVQFYKKALSLSNRKIYYFNINQAYSGMGEWDKGIEYLNKGIKQFPYYYKLYDAKGWDLIYLGKKDEAIKKGVFSKAYDLYIREYNNGKAFEYNTILHLPFKGRWKVIQGNGGQESHLGLNFFSYDFVKVDKEGHSYKYKPKKNIDFFSYGEKIFAPAPGTIIEIKNDTPDNIYPNINKKENGNFVFIKHNNDSYSLLVHFKKGSITVKPGEHVNTGDYIGECGNSGYSYGPHLHYSLCDENKTSVSSEFSNYLLLSNSRIKRIRKGTPILGEIIEREDN